MEQHKITNKTGYARGIVLTTEKQGLTRSADLTTEQGGHGVWASVPEYARITNYDETTIRRWIKKGIFPGDVRKNLKLKGLKGSGYEVEITTERDIKILLALRRMRSAGLGEFNKKVKPNNSTPVKFNVPSHIYLAGTTFKNKVTFPDYLAIALTRMKGQLQKTRQINIRIRKQEHLVISAMANEAGLPIVDVYRTFYEQYVTNLYNDTKPKEEVEL